MENERKQQLNSNFNKVITKKRALLFTALYIFSTSVLLASATDIFTTLPQRSYMVFYILIAVNTFFVFRIWRLYKAQNK